MSAARKIAKASRDCFGCRESGRANGSRSEGNSRSQHKAISAAAATSRRVYKTSAKRASRGARIVTSACICNRQDSVCEAGISFPFRELPLRRQTRYVVPRADIRIPFGDRGEEPAVSSLRSSYFAKSLRATTPPFITHFTL